MSASGTAAEYIIPGETSGPGWSAGVRLDAPLWTGGIGRARIDAAAAALRRARAELEQQERALSAAQASGDARYAAAVSSAEARRAAADAAERAHTEVDARYAEGLVGIVDWLDARRERDEAAVASALADGEVGAALAELEAARGVR